MSYIKDHILLIVVMILEFIRSETFFFLFLFGRSKNELSKGLFKKFFIIKYLISMSARRSLEYFYVSLTFKTKFFLQKKKQFYRIDISSKFEFEKSA